MTTPNIDTKALRELLSKGHYDLAAVFELFNAAPALLDLAERAQEQAKEIERLDSGWQRCLAEWRDEVRRFNAGHARRAESYFELEDEIEQMGWAWANVDEINRLKVEVAEIAAKLSASEREAERLRAALTPSGATKFAYMNEFKFNVVREGPDHSEIVERHAVPWTTIKDIMAAIAKRAALRGEEGN